MNRRFFSALFFNRLVAIVLVLAVASSCSKKDEPSAQGAIAGIWKLSALLITEVNDPEEDLFPLFLLFGGTCLSDLTFTFNSNGTLTTNTPATCKTLSEDLADEGLVTSGKWEINGSKFLLTGVDGTKEEYDYSLSGDVLSLIQKKTEPDPADPKKTITTLTTLKFKKA